MMEHKQILINGDQRTILGVGIRTMSTTLVRTLWWLPFADDWCALLAHFGHEHQPMNQNRSSGLDYPCTRLSYYLRLPRMSRTFL